MIPLSTIMAGRCVSRDEKNHCDQSAYAAGQTEMAPLGVLVTITNVVMRQPNTIGWWHVAQAMCYEQAPRLAQVRITRMSIDDPKILLVSSI